MRNLEYMLRLRDQLTGPMNQAAANVDRQFGNMNRSARMLPRSIDDITRRLDDLRRTRNISIDTRQIRNANREITQLERQLNRLQGAGARGGGPSGGGLFGLAGSVMSNPYVQGALALGSGIGVTANAFMQKETAITGLSTFLGKDGAASAYKNIRRDADVTSYDTASLLQVNRALIAAGLNAKDARQDTMNLANAVAAVGGGNEELQRMAVNMQQIKTVGKATAGDIRQFGIAGINIYKMLSEATGKSIAEVKEMEVSYDLLSYALARSASSTGIYAGALEAQGKTLAGKWSTFKDQIAGILTDIGDAESGFLVKTLDTTSKALSFWVNMFKNWKEINSINLRIVKLQFVDLAAGIHYSFVEAGFKILAWADELAIKLRNKIRSAIRGFTGGMLGGDDESTRSSFRDSAENAANKKQWIQGNAAATIYDLDQRRRQLQGLGTKSASDSPTGLDATRKYNYAGSTPDDAKKAEEKARKDAVKRDVDSIAGGGARNTYITLGKFQDQVNIHAMSAREGINEMEDMLEKSLLKILNSANAITN